MISVGTVLSQRYKIIRTLGTGGTATVYLAQDLILERQVAVKVLRHDFSNEEKALRRFQREARLVSDLVHPNIVNLYDIDEDNNQQYIVMEYVDGIDLKQYIRRHAPLSLVVIIDIMKQVASALHHAHQQGIIHRDLKTQNILIHRDGTAKITDFGIATGLTELEMTQTNTLIGSIHYLSPEQTRGNRATIQSDMYSLGVVFYEMIMNDVPFNGDSAVSIAMKHFHNPVPSVVQRARQTVPQSVENIILKSLAKQPQNRYQDCVALLADLRTCLQLNKQNVPKYHEPSALKNAGQKNARPSTIQSVPIHKTAYAKPMPKLPKKKRWLKWIGGIVASLGLVALGVIVWLFFQQSTLVKVPKILGKSQTEAMTLVTNAGLIVDNIVQEPSDTVPKGLVIRATYEADSQVERHSRITLVISSGEKEEKIENYKNQSYASVYQKLRDKGFIVERQSQQSATVPIGQIISQSISAGTLVKPKGTVISFTVSTGAQEFGYYIGQLYESVKPKLEALGYEVSVDYQQDASQNIGVILDQNISYGALVTPEDTPVILTVNKGVQMPDVTGDLESEASEQLATLGLSNVTYVYEHANKPAGTVIKQSVASGGNVSNGSHIVLTISEGEQLTTGTTQTTSSSRQTTQTSE